MNTYLWKLNRIFFLIFLLMILFMISCSKNDSRKLSKMSFEEEIKMRLNKEFDLSNSIIYDQNGDEIKQIHLDSIKKGLVGFNHYVDESKIIRKTILRDRHYTDNLTAAVVNKNDPSFRNINRS